MSSKEVYLYSCLSLLQDDSATWSSRLWKDIPFVGAFWKSGQISEGFYCYVLCKHIVALAACNATVSSFLESFHFLIDAFKSFQNFVFERYFPFKCSDDACIHVSPDTARGFALCCCCWEVNLIRM